MSASEFYDKLATLMARAGFDEVQRLDDVFFQPVLVGIRPDEGEPQRTWTSAVSAARSPRVRRLA